MAEDRQPQPRQGWRIKDARGRKVTQLDPVAMHLLHQHDVIDPDVLRAIVREQGVRIAGMERAGLIVGIMSALLVISLFTYAVLSGDIADAPLAKTSSLFFLCAIPWVAWFRAKHTRMEHVTTALLKHLRCPHCGYDLRMLPTDPADGATICPECGCAWNLGEAPVDPPRREKTSHA